VTFFIAVPSHWIDDAGERQTRTDWQNIVAFGNLRKYAVKLKKGDPVHVEAEPETAITSARSAPES
jgi:single-strand DNA-binding protein